MSGDEPRDAATSPTTLELEQELTRPQDLDEEPTGVVDDDLVAELTAVTRVRRPGDESMHEVEVAIAPAATATSTSYLEERARQLRQEAAAAASARRAAVLLYELGRLHERGLKQVDQALACYRESHDRFPSLAINARALRRLLASAGDHAGERRVLDAELGAATSAPERAAVLVERAIVRAAHLSDPDGAEHDCNRALEIDPEDPVAMDLLADLQRRRDAQPDLEQLRRHRLRSCESPALRSALLCEIARMRESAGDLEEASALYRTALNAAPTNVPAMRALLRTARASGDHPGIATLCEALAEAEPHAAAGYLWEAARIYADRLRNTDLAARALRRACDRTPDLALLLELADLYQRDRKWNELADVLREALDLAGNVGEAVSVATRLGQIQLERLQQPDAAVVSLGRALDLDPDHIPARRMLGRLYARREQWPQLIQLLEAELEQVADAARQGAILYRIGDLVERRLRDPERAVSIYEQALALAPGYRPAIRGVSRVYAQLGRHDDLVATFERELAQVAEREAKILLLGRISEIWQRQIGDTEAARVAYERLTTLDPANLLALRSLRRIYAASNQSEELVGTLRAEADQTLDRWRRVSLLTESAEVQEEQLEDPDAALATYLEVLDLAPAHQPALMAAGRLLKRADRFEDLVRVHQRELGYCEDAARRAWLLLKIGRIQLERLDRVDDAIACFGEAMQLDPASQAAADQLVRLHLARESYNDLFQVLIKRPTPATPAALSLHQRRIAEVLRHSQRPPLSIEHLRRAVAASDDDAAMQLLARFYGTIDDRQGLITLHQLTVERAGGTDGAAAAHYHLARLFADAEHDQERAIEQLERLLNLLPRDQVVLRWLEQLLCGLGRWEEVVAVLELARESSEDEDFRTACAAQMSGVLEDELEDLTRAAQSAVEVLARDATNAEATATLERHHRRTRNPAGLIQVLSRRARAAQTVQEQAALLAAIASAHAQAGDLGQSADVYRLATNRLPTYLPAILGWLKVARALGDNEQLGEALELQAVATGDPGARARCDFDAARTWQLLSSEQERAIAAYERVLEVDPLHAETVAALRKIHSDSGNWSRLAELLRHTARHTESPEQRREILAQVATIERDRLQDLLAARRTITAALEIDPNHPQLLETLAELCRIGSDWKGLAQVTARLIEIATDALSRRALHFELGTLWDDKLANPDRAVAEYRRVLELDDGDLGALTRLSALLYRQKDWIPAAQITERLIARDDDRDRVRQSHLKLSHIYADGFSDVPGAIEACRRALALDPGDLDATEQMASLLTRTGELRALHAHLESTLTVHRARLEREPFLEPSYRALLRVFSRQSAPDRIYVVRTLLHSIGAATLRDQAYIEERWARAPTASHRALTHEETEGLLVHPNERGALRRLLLAAEPALRKLYAAAERSIAKPARISVRTAPALADELQHLNRAIGGGTFHAFLADVEGRELWVEDTSTPSVFISGALARRLAEPETRFRLARVLAHLRLRHLIPGRLGEQGLARVVDALLAVLCAGYQPQTERGDAEVLAGALERALGRRNRSQLEQAALELADHHLEPDLWLSAMAQSEDRLALAVCGDVRAAVNTLLRDEGSGLRAGKESLARYEQVAGPRLRQLLSFAVSDEYLTLRERLGMAVTS